MIYVWNARTVQRSYFRTSISLLFWLLVYLKALAGSFVCPSPHCVSYVRMYIWAFACMKVKVVYKSTDRPCRRQSHNLISIFNVNLQYATWTLNDAIHTLRRKEKNGNPWTFIFNILCIFSECFCEFFTCSLKCDWKLLFTYYSILWSFLLVISMLFLMQRFLINCKTCINVNVRLVDRPCR